MANLLSENEIKAELEKITGWSVEGKKLQRTWTLSNFVEAIAFVNKLVEPSEKAGHHPDIEISYNKVTVKLTTHDAGGLTEKDFQLAKVISELT
ncbi:MAG: 4a-hydroxytetrahydrobiopterin dehydratase [Oscillatoriaceae bacterium SKW80]|nr:4a-hydroxytetrahydrobiopterin dehydratase [Oscillatoriaceae bacterium SKYG93]MCX8122335.1 4a-hydroxytetrahydrobiopterin dehydratase [Oscillatoriaceae bacterium SKW80]MDW8452443.1 4a-hydroxytetrahydrobiopterin dehydratase [Oscillatoriaceae cyanobacterium SKYGB_i_bin93]HIK27721.1 4a-hydroxytetrahydrobiopterin dehydratase [Oscillatoriaceae cyanobacterium M7585_C2015_266]